MKGTVCFKNMKTFCIYILLCVREARWREPRPTKLQSIAFTSHAHIAFPFRNMYDVALYSRVHIMLGSHRTHPNQHACCRGASYTATAQSILPWPPLSTYFRPLARPRVVEAAHAALLARLLLAVCTTFAHLRLHRRCSSLHVVRPSTWHSIRVRIRSLLYALRAHGHQLAPARRRLMLA